MGPQPPPRCENWALFALRESNLISYLIASVVLISLGNFRKRSHWNFYYRKLF
jgi:hypothetical protein